MSHSKSVDREAPVQGALVIHPDREGRGDARLPAARLEEAAGLALALDLEVRETMAVNLRKLTPAKVADVHVPVVTFLLLVIIYFVVTFEKISLCMSLGMSECQ